MSMASKSVPAVIVSGVVCLCLGAAITFGVMESIGRVNKEAAANPGNLAITRVRMLDQEVAPRVVLAA